MSENLEAQWSRRGFAFEVASVAAVSLFGLFLAILFGYFALAALLDLFAGIPSWYLLTWIPLLASVVGTVQFVRCHGYRRWSYVATRCRIDGNTLEYQLAREPTPRHVSLDRIAWVTTFYPSEKRPNPTASYCITDADNNAFFIDAALFRNAVDLLRVLRNRAVKNRVNNLRAEVSLDNIPQDHPLMPKLAPYLQEKEEVYWLGFIDRPRLWNARRKYLINSFAASGLLAALFLALLIAYFVIPDLPDRWDKYAVWTAIGFAAMPIVAWIDIYQAKKYYRHLGETLYAVTSRRAIAIDGFYWSSCRWQTPWHGYQLEEWIPSELMDYEAFNTDDLVLGGKRTRKLPFQTLDWWYQGFFAIEDRNDAHHAIIRLLDQHYAELFPKEDSSI